MMYFGWLKDPNSPWWNVASVAGSWLAGIGTVFMAGVALWLARRDRRIVLQLIATLGSPAPNHSEGPVMLSISNLGVRKVVLSALGFRVGLLPSWSPFLPVNYLVLYPNHKQTPFRHPLDDGDNFVAAESFHPTVVTIADLLTRPMWLSAWTLRFWAHTTVDVNVGAWIKPRLRRRVLQLARRPRT